jgi:hypothetical protein
MIVTLSKVGWQHADWIRWPKIGMSEEVNTEMKPLSSGKCNFLTSCALVLNSLLVDVKTFQSCDTVTSNSAFL